MNGIGSHTRPGEGATDEWLTPPWLLDALGPFDLDPCAPIVRPWEIARKHFTVDDDGLAQPWAGRVWCNPPYGAETWRWLERLADHGDGLALIFARTETAGFATQVWQRATALLFIRGRLTFHRVDGSAGAGNSGGPSVLVAYGQAAADRLEGAAIDGAFVRVWYVKDAQGSLL